MTGVPRFVKKAMNSEGRLAEMSDISDVMDTLDPIFTNILGSSGWTLVVLRLSWLELRNGVTPPNTNEIHLCGGLCCALP